MSTDFTKIQLSSSASSNKVFKENSGSPGTIIVAALGGAGETQSTAAIPHGFGSDILIPQVTTIGVGTDGTIIPWQSSDSRITQYTRLDNTNLYITIISQDSSGFGAAGFTATYYYRLLIP